MQRFEDFWRYVVKAEVDIVQLVLDDALAFNFQVNGDLGGHEPYAGYERRLDIELFSRANSRTYTPFFLFDGSYSIKGFLTVVNLVWEFTLTVETQDF